MKNFALTHSQAGFVENYSFIECSVFSYKIMLVNPNSTVELGFFCKFKYYICTTVIILYEFVMKR